MIAFIVIVVAIFVAIVYKENFKNRGLIGTLPLNGLITNSATSTTSALPVLVLDTNASRRYAMICNDSDTVAYLYLGNFASGAAASTTVVVGKGIRLNASGSCYTMIDDENLWQGQVWATSTAASKSLIYVEK